MAADLDQTPPRFVAGPYLGEISALSFLPLPSHLSSFPLLLAGTGSEILVYDAESGQLLDSFHVFEGIRVHGISLRSPDPGNYSSVEFSIALFGERRVKLFLLCVDAKESIRLELVDRLPRFDHWVLDACFLKEDDRLAVGLSDNSVAIWDISSSNVACRVKSTERCLLYSMRMWGESTEGLCVASGTIYNEIIVWKLSSQDLVPSSELLVEPINHRTSCHNDIELPGQRYMSTQLGRLIGHEGSIFRIAWSSDGQKLMSVSDDRSARIWVIGCQGQDIEYQGEIHGCNLSANLVLFGHNARIWDCYISDSIVITAGEDCTCRVWGLDGKPLLTVKEHTGRGIWRCLYDPGLSLLMTAGFDAAVKVHLIHSSTLRGMNLSGVLNEFKDHTEVFNICVPKVSKQLGMMDSKSEYVRCLQFTRENMLYVATNNGYVHLVELCNPGDIKWSKVANVNNGSPIICMDLISSSSSEDIIAVGDAQGSVTVVRLASDPILKFARSFTWLAEKERQLLGIYWCKSLGCSHIFTADPRGLLKLWKISDGLQPRDDTTGIESEVHLIAVYASCFGARIMCVDASMKDEIVVCGDQRGNLAVYPLSMGLVAAKSTDTVEKVSAVNHFKSAHGISCVTSIFIGKMNLNQVEIRTTGGDGCICYFKYDKDLQSLEFIGMKQVKELSTIHSVPTNSTPKLAQENYAVGFTSADFIIWNLANETKMLQIPCGGWRRPYSYYIGAVPKYQSCFAYVKDYNIHIHRLWMPVKESRLFPKVLHMQYHGREVHSLCFIASELQLSSIESSCLWIATGCEDGTVRLTRYTYFGKGSWCESRLLGEHVGGSAVRSIYFTSKIYTVKANQTCNSNNKNFSHALLDTDQFLLISVGAKQVLTSWILRQRTPDIEEVHLSGSISEFRDKSSPSKAEFSSISFQWLSTHMPPKFSSTHQKTKKLMKPPERGKAWTMKSASLSGLCVAECGNQKPKSVIMDHNENDWRYMAVTAFLVKHADSRITVCFIVVACSDATLSLRALLLPYRLWFDIAILVPQPSPVLALQHVVVPGYAHSKDDVQVGNAYIVISGSTDGSITFWNLTETVEHFMQLVLELQPEMHINCQRRPRTGRGSEGGRWWRSISNQSSRKSASDASNRIEACNSADDQSSETNSSSTSMRESDLIDNRTSCSQTSSPTSSPMPRGQSDIMHSEIHEVRPLCILQSVHQSGVNCLHVSEMQDCVHSESEMNYCVVSGGDDQALHYLVFNFGVQTTSFDSSHSQSTDNTNIVKDRVLIQSSGSSFIGKASYESLNNDYQLKILCRDSTASAHSSAVKGIWTDGSWAFSTGLDQRVRCWKIGRSGTLTEHAHLVISVPEPETLDAVFCDSSRKRYQIAVAGRGTQMVEFYLPQDET